jgi:hypothetical protein
MYFVAHERPERRGGRETPDDYPTVRARVCTSSSSSGGGDRFLSRGSAAKDNNDSDVSISERSATSENRLRQYPGVYQRTDRGWDRGATAFDGLITLPREGAAAAASILYVFIERVQLIMIACVDQSRVALIDAGGNSSASRRNERTKHKHHLHSRRLL